MQEGDPRGGVSHLKALGECLEGEGRRGGEWGRGNGRVNVRGDYVKDQGEGRVADGEGRGGRGGRRGCEGKV